MTRHERPDERAITSPSSGRARRIAALSGRSARRKQGLQRVDGPQAVRSLLQHRPELLQDLYLTSEAAQAHPDITAPAPDGRTHEVAPEVLRAMSAGEGEAVGSDGVVSPQGVLAVARIDAPGLDAALVDLPPDGAGVLVLCEVQDPGNVGTLIRTADAAGACLVITTRGTADVSSPKVVRSAAGSTFHLPLVSGAAPEELLRALRVAGVHTVATSAHATEDLFDAQLPDRIAWLMGNEAHGLPDDLLTATEQRVRIPLAGHAESLNVATAAALCLFESLRRSRLR